MSTFHRPFLKWAGGKSRLLPRIHKVLPQGERLIEPFVGAGAVFLNSDFDSYLLADINPDLINLFQILKNQKQSFINYASEYFVEKNNQKLKYYELRELFNQTGTGKLRAALFLYMNRHGYNGLCRYNQKGKFNVPFGKFKRPYFPALEMEYFCKLAARAEFVCADFREVMNSANKGDVIYADPPYVPISATAYFTQYAQQGFNHKCQKDLAETAQKLALDGVNVIISNHDNAATRRLYKQSSVKSFYVQRNISCQGTTRNKVKELLACYYPEVILERELLQQKRAI